MEVTLAQSLNTGMLHTHTVAGHGCPRPSPRCYVGGKGCAGAEERQLGQRAGNVGQSKALRNYQIYLRELSGKCILSSVNSFYLFFKFV